MNRALPITICLAGLACACAPLETGPRASVTVSATNVLAVQSPQYPPVRLYMGPGNEKNCDSGEVISMDIENATLSCTLCEAVVSDWTPERLVAQSILCRSYLEHQRCGAPDNPANRDQCRFPAGKGKYANLRKCGAHLPADSYGQNMSQFSIESDRKVILCRNRAPGKQRVDLEQYRDKIDAINSRRGVVLGRRNAQGHLIVEETEYSNCGMDKEIDGRRERGHGRGWCQDTHYPAGTTHDQMLMGVDDFAKLGLKLDRLPYGPGALPQQEPETAHEDSIPAATDGSRSGNSDAQAIRFGAGLPDPTCVPCRVGNKCGCWKHDGANGIVSSDGYCDLWERSNCKEALGAHYALYFSSAADSAASTASAGDLSRFPANADPTASPGREITGRETTGAPQTFSATKSLPANDSCSGVEICNGQDDDCDPSTVDGSGDEALFETCALPVSQGAMLVTAGTATQPGSLICQGGELVCVGETERVEFEQVVAASREQGTSEAADDAAAGCPLQSRISTGHVGGASWVLLLLLWIRLGRAARRSSHE